MRADKEKLANSTESRTSVTGLFVLHFYYTVLLHK